MVINLMLNSHLVRQIILLIHSISNNTHFSHCQLNGFRGWALLICISVHCYIILLVVCLLLNEIVPLPQLHLSLALWWGAQLHTSRLARPISAIHTCFCFYSL